MDALNIMVRFLISSLRDVLGPPDFFLTIHLLSGAPNESFR